MRTTTDADSLHISLRVPVFLRLAQGRELSVWMIRNFLAHYTKMLGCNERGFNVNVFILLHHSALVTFYCIDLKASLCLICLIKVVCIYFLSLPSGFEFLDFYLFLLVYDFIT